MGIVPIVGSPGLRWMGGGGGARGTCRLSGHVSAWLCGMSGPEGELTWGSQLGYGSACSLELSLGPQTSLVPCKSVRNQVSPGELKNLSQGREKETLRELPFVHGRNRATLLPQFNTLKKKGLCIYFWLCWVSFAAWAFSSCGTGSGAQAQ